MTTADITWQDVVAAPFGHIFVDVEGENGTFFVVLRGPKSLCAYLSAPVEHPLEGVPYQDIDGVIPVHGGFTHSGTLEHFPAIKEQRHWFGWDYAHGGDRSVSDAYGPIPASTYETSWTPSMVVDDSWSARYAFDQLVKLMSRCKA